MEWVEVLNQLINFPITHMKWNQFHYSDPHSKSYSLPETSIRHTFRWKNLSPFKRKLEKEVQCPEIRDYSEENVESETNERVQSATKKKEETIRYEWCREGDTNRVVISFITPESEKCSPSASPAESFVASNESFSSSASSIDSKTISADEGKKSLFSGKSLFGGKSENLKTRHKDEIRDKYGQAKDSQIERVSSDQCYKTFSTKIPSTHSGYYEIEGIQVKKRDRPTLRKKTSNISVITISMVQTSKVSKQYIQNEADSLLYSFRKHPPSSLPELRNSLVVHSQFPKLSSPLSSTGIDGPYKSECTITIPAPTGDRKSLIYQKSEQSSMEDQRNNFMSSDYPNSSFPSLGDQKKYSLPLITLEPQQLILYRSKLKKISTFLKGDPEIENHPKLPILQPKIINESVQVSKMNASRYQPFITDTQRHKSRLPVPTPKFKETFITKSLSNLKKICNVTSDKRQFKSDRRKGKPGTPYPRLKRATFSPNLVRANRRFALSSSPSHKKVPSSVIKKSGPTRATVRCDLPAETKHFPKNASMSFCKRERETATKATSAPKVRKASKDPITLLKCSKSPKSILKSVAKPTRLKMILAVPESTSLPVIGSNKRYPFTSETFRVNPSLSPLPVVKPTSKIPMPLSKALSVAAPMASPVIEHRQQQTQESPPLPIKIDTSAPVSKLILHNFFSVTPKGALRRYPLVVTSNFKELSPYLLNNSFSSNEKVDCDDITDDEKDTSCLNGHHSPFAYDEQNRVQLTPIEDDGLANISVKQLVGTYASTFTPASATHATSSIQTTTSNVTACQLYPSDFTPGVTFKTLKSTYEASAQKRPSPCAFPIKDEVHVSFMQLRDAYCNVASNSPREGNSPTPRSTTTLKTPSTFRSMIRKKSLICMYFL